MKYNEIFDRLENVAKAYNWNVDNDGRITAVIKSGFWRGRSLNPITALAHKAGLAGLAGFWITSDTRRGTEFAARLLGIPRSVARQFYSATIASRNNGNTQVLRGRIRQALEV
jgi:hypothetical protein